VQSKYLRTALAHAHLWPSFKTHIASAVIGIAAFCYEDIATDHWGWPPVLHSLWHCLSAVAMGCTHCLLGHVEVAAALAEGMQL
jgi:AhpD family alkylhydroperoxidase